MGQEWSSARQTVSRCNSILSILLARDILASKFHPKLTSWGLTVHSLLVRGIHVKAARRAGLLSANAKPHRYVPLPPAAAPPAVGSPAEGRLRDGGAAALSSAASRPPKRKGSPGRSGACRCSPLQHKCRCPRTPPDLLPPAHVGADTSLTPDSPWRAGGLLPALLRAGGAAGRLCGATLRLSLRGGNPPALRLWGSGAGPRAASAGAAPELSATPSAFSLEGRRPAIGCPLCPQALVVAATPRLEAAPKAVVSSRNGARDTPRPLATSARPGCWFSDRKVILESLATLLIHIFICVLISNPPQASQNIALTASHFSDVLWHHEALL